MAGSNMVEHKLRLLIETELDEKQKQQVGKQLKTILEGAAIGFDEAETKKNIVPIIRMIQKLFDKAEMKFDADKLLGMPSQKALQSIADITAEEFQTAFDRALAKSGGIKIDFGNIDLSGMTEPLERVAGELAEISQKIANDTKKSVDDIEASIKRLNKVKPKTITTKVVEDGVEKKVTKEVSRVEQTIETIEKTLDAANNPKSLNTEKAAVKALEKAKDKYTESVSKGDPWEIQYQYLVSFVSKYEAMTKKIKPIMDANHAEFKELYDVLSPKAGAAKISLEHFVDVSRGNELSEYKNQPWARESTLKKIEQTLKGGISVKDGGDKEDPVQKEQPKPTTGPKPVSGDDNNGKKLNTKVDPAAPKKKVDAAKEVLDLTQQTRVEEEKAAEAAVKAAESVSDAITEPVLTELQKRIVDAVEEAKAKSIRDWETGTPNSERNRIMAETIKSNFIFSEDANDDDIDDIINNAVSFSVGDMEADEIEDVFKPFIVSLEDAYNQASSEAKELVKQLAGIKDPNSNEALDILDQIADIDEQLNGIINHVIESYMGPWEKFRDKILGNTTGATSSSTKTAGSSRDNIQTILDDANKFLSSNTDKKIEDYFELIATGAIEMSNDVKSAIESTIGSIDSLQYVNAGANNRGGLIGDKSALILKKPHWNANDKKWAVDKQQNDDAIELQNRLSGADVSDVNLGKIQEVINAEEYLVELQSRVSGAPISTIGEAIAGINPDILNITEASVRNLISAMRELYNMGVETDVENLGNILYDGQGDQFGIVDMDVKHDFESFEDMLAAFAQTVRNHVEDVATILNDPKMVQAWTRFADMVDGAVGNISTHQTETEIEGVRQQNEALKENIKLKEQSAETQESMYSAEESTVDNDDLGKQVEVKATIESDELRSILEGITYNVKVAQDAERTNDSKVSIDAEELKRTLKAITYNVKVAHEADVADSKVSIDEAALEGVLNKVFANILNPGDEVKVDTAALADAISKIQITPDNERLIAEIKALMPTLGGLAQENTLQAIKILLEQKDAPTAQKMPPEVKLETSSKRDDRFERLADVASMYEDVEDVESAIKEFGSVYKEIVLISDEATKVIKANKTGINTLRKIANETLDTSDYSWVEFKRNEQYAPVAEKQGAGTVSIDEGALKQLLNSIVYNVKIAYDDGDKGANKIAIDENGLKNVLNSIAYNVKVVQDDDGADSKIAIDEASLEATLNKVFANILNPPEQQNDSEHAQEPWALENTLQAVNGVLENIQNNTAKNVVEGPAVDQIEGTALDRRLTEIKSVLESIEKKIIDGGKIVNRGGAKQAYKESQKDPGTDQAARSNMMKSLINDYKTMGKLAAQFANDGDLKTKAMLDNLKEEINRKRRSLKLTMDENKNLREKYSIAFDAEKRLLEAEKAQSEINAKNKADAKDAEVAWKKQVKDAQRATGINAATSIANSGDQTVLRAIGVKDVSDDISQKAKELSDQIKALRAVRDEIDKKGDQASEEDRNNLSKQIASVKTLKSELDGYLKIHEKYSGDDATDLGDASNFGAVGTNEYWNNITAAVKAQAEGRVAIKGLNADTGELTGTTKIAANTFATWSATVDPLTGRLSMLRTGIKKTETLVESITRKTKEVFTYFSGSSVVFKFFNEIKRGIQYVKEIDLALTELKKVTDETEESYDRFLETAAKTAEKVGSTIQKVVSSTADWARLGSILADTNVRPII